MHGILIETWHWPISVEMRNAWRNKYNCSLPTPRGCCPTSEPRRIQMTATVAKSLQETAFDLHAQGVSLAAFKLKRMGLEGDLTSLEQACETLVKELERLQTLFAVFLQENSRGQS